MVIAAAGRQRTIGRVDVSAFLRDGYVAVRDAFGQRTARACDELIGAGRWTRRAGVGGTPPRRRRARRLQSSVLCRRAAEDTGQAGDVYLCHPFVVHTATWPHRGSAPRMLAQPAVGVPDGFALDGSDPSPVAEAMLPAWREPTDPR